MESKLSYGQKCEEEWWSYPRLGMDELRLGRRHFLPCGRAVVDC